MTQLDEELTISKDALLAVLEEVVHMHGIRGTGRKFGLSGAYISAVVNGKEGPGRRLVAALGYSQIETRYRKKP